MLSATQEAELMLLAAEAARLFVEEENAVLDPATTDWDGVAFADATHTLSWITALIPGQYQEAWECYQHTLIAETARLMAGGWRVFVGSETRHCDGSTGRPADAEAWYAEPRDYTGATLWSPPFRTRADAEAWVAAQPEERETA